jgi:hypothetical protein
MQKGWVTLLVCGALWAGFTPERAHADLLTNQRHDKVELEDGTVIECIVVIETPKGVLVLMPGKAGENAGQKLIPKERVKKITRGTDEGRFQGFQTESETARKVIQGTGFRDTLKTTAKETGPATPAGPIGPIAPIVQPAATGNTAGNVVTAKPMKLTPAEVIKEYLARYPELKTTAGPLLADPARASQWLDKAITFSPEVRARVEELLGRINQSTVDQPPPSAVVAPGAAPKTRTPAVRGGPAAPPATK